MPAGESVAEPDPPEPMRPRQPSDQPTTIAEPAPVRREPRSTAERTCHGVMRLAQIRCGEASGRNATPDGTMTLTEHLGELRQRIIRAGLAVIVGMIAILAFYDQVLALPARALRATVCERTPTSVR